MQAVYVGRCGYVGPPNKCAPVKTRDSRCRQRIVRASDLEACATRVTALSFEAVLVEWNEQSRLC